MLGPSREKRESEKYLARIWSVFPHLQICTWYGKGLTEDAIHYAEEMRDYLDKMIEELRIERAQNYKP